MTCTKCTVPQTISYKGLKFCETHYTEFLNTRLYKQVRQHLRKTDELFMQFSPQNPVLLNGIFSYFRHNPTFFEQITFSEDCPDYTDLYKQFQPSFQGVQRKGVRNESQCEVSAICGQQLAIDALMSVSMGDLTFPVNRLKTTKFLLRDFSFSDVQRLAGVVDFSAIGPAMLEASIDFEAVLGCLGRVQI